MQYFNVKLSIALLSISVCAWGTTDITKFSWFWVAHIEDLEQGNSLMEESRADIVRCEHAFFIKKLDKKELELFHEELEHHHIVGVLLKMESHLLELPLDLQCQLLMKALPYNRDNESSFFNGWIWAGMKAFAIYSLAVNVAAFGYFGVFERH